MNIFAKFGKLASSLLLGSGLLAATSWSQAPTFAGNAQHTSLYSGVAAQPVNKIKWQSVINEDASGAFAHFGMPLVSQNNFVFAPVYQGGGAFRIDVFDGATGTKQYSETSDYKLPSYNWIPVYEPCLTIGNSGNRLYYAGAGGTLYYVDNPDSATPSAPTQIAFYGLANYTGNTAGFNSTVFVDTPITADSNGTIFFGFRVQGTAPAPLSTNSSGYARIDRNGNASYVLVNAASGDGQILRDSHNAAPALSNDGSTVYVVCKWANNAYYGYLLGLDSTSLATKYKVFLKDPRNNNSQNAGILDDSTASPTIGPDNDVYLGVFGNPYNGSRGWLLHFSQDLATEYTPGAFGWDQTVGIVPATMVPSYHGPSSYLLLSKYNNYANVTDGNGINRVAILDPHSTQVDFHPTAPGQVEMREVQTVIGVTPDTENPTVHNAIREWCINASVINPQTGNVYFDSEDGHLYCWNLASNSLTQAVTLTAGIGEPYVPTTMGPDGTIYTLNGSYIFALGNDSNVKLTLDSSSPSVQSTLLGDNVTFTATVTGASAPTGTVTFTDVSYDGFTQTSNTLGTVTLTPVNNTDSVATFSTNSLLSGGTSLGNHWITASYSGDATYNALSTTRMQKVHQASSVTAVTPSNATPNFGDAVTFSVNVSEGVGAAGLASPSGYVTFTDAQNNVLGQLPVDASGNTSLTVSNFSVGSHTVNATYVGDTDYAMSLGSATVTVGSSTSVSLASSANPSSYGQAVTLTATVSSGISGAGIPQGTVTFTSNGVLIGSAPVDSTGTATLTLSNLAPGTDNLVANFGGNTGWAGASSAIVAEVVSADTTVSLVTSANPSTFGSLLTLTATAVGSNGSGVPSGSVTFSDGSTVLGTVPVDGSGNASLPISTLAIGTHNLSVTFAGNTGWNGSSSSPVSELVNSGTSTALTSSLNPSGLGASVTFTATVTASASGVGNPVGNVTFSDGSAVLGTVAVDANGVAVLATSSLAAGTHNIAASFAGATGWVNSGSNTVAQSVLNTSTMTLTASPSTVNFGQTVTLSVKVTSSSSVVPKGSVVFTSNGVTLGTKTLTTTGTAALATTKLVVGNPVVVATYTSTNGLQGSTGSTSVKVNDVTPPTTPGSFRVTGVTGGIKLTWAASRDTDSPSITYLIFRADSATGTFTQVSSTSALSFTDNVSTGVTKFYYVIATDPTGNRSVKTSTLSARAK